MIANFKRQIENKYPIIGTIITLPVPEIIEILTLAGFDWLFIDAEHSSLGIKECSKPRSNRRETNSLDSTRA